MGASCLRENGILKTGNKDKADILSRQFGSVYTRDNAGDIPLKGLNPYPDIEDISIDPSGVKKLLGRLNLNKASGPDDLSARVLKECSAEIAQVLACIFNQSLIQLYQTTGVKPMWLLYIRKERSTTQQITGQFL